MNKVISVLLLGVFVTSAQAEMLFSSPLLAEKYLCLINNISNETIKGKIEFVHLDGTVSNSSGTCGKEGRGDFVIEPGEICFDAIFQQYIATPKYCRVAHDGPDGAILGTLQSKNGVSDSDAAVALKAAPFEPKSRRGIDRASDHVIKIIEEIFSD